jgi:AcrR family transcriptional regulator
LATDGYAKTTTNNIAERAGVGIGSLYNFFPNKQAIVAALVDRKAKEELDAVRDGIREAANKDPYDAARALAARLLANHRGSGDADKQLMHLLKTVDRQDAYSRATAEAIDLTLSFNREFFPSIGGLEARTLAFVCVQSLASVAWAAHEARKLGVTDEMLVDHLAVMISSYVLTIAARSRHGSAAQTSEALPAVCD